MREGEVERVIRAIEREGDRLFRQIAIDVGARAAMGNVIARGCVHAKNGASVGHFALYLHPVAQPNGHAVYLWRESRRRDQYLEESFGSI